MPNTLTIDREIDDVKAQVKKEIDTIRGLMDSLGYRSDSPGWDAPFQIHRLRRALRIHYLAMKIRGAAAEPDDLADMLWDLNPDDEVL
ncbi:hypothetical protein EU546_03935 [Candidatus Thorarchaeota archaeon]|nr:MAG: hypothetical protein EU546_03935 [Candidatus Thorarchaeota archaeon]